MLHTFFFLAASSSESSLLCSLENPKFSGVFGHAEASAFKPQLTLETISSAIALAAIVAAAYVYILVVGVMIWLIIHKDGRLFHCAHWGLSLIGQDWRCAPAVVDWLIKLIFFWKPEPNHHYPDVASLGGLRLYRMKRENMPKAFNSGQIHRFRKYFDDKIHEEQSVLLNTLNTTFLYDIVRMPVPFLGYGLCNGGRSIPPDTVVALYFSDFFEFYETDDTSHYIFYFGKPKLLAYRITNLDGKPRLADHPNSSALFANHKCLGSNCKFDWNGDILEMKTTEMIPPYAPLSVQYQNDPADDDVNERHKATYFYDQAQTAQRLAAGLPVCRCLCNAPLLCPLGRSLVTFD